MKEFIIENQSLILVNHKNKFYMIGGKCTHRGASLINGKLSFTLHFTVILVDEEKMYILFIIKN